MTDGLASKSWYDSSHRRDRFAAQRRYPNEELLRFFSRQYFAVPPEQRRAVRVLEMGCGSGANLWMIAREGFDAYGIDQSPEAIALCEQMLGHWDAKATLRVGDMTNVPYPPGHFDVIADVFSSYCLNETAFARFLAEVVRLLRPGGHFFSYAPSKDSDAFKNPGPSRHIDSSTLDGISRETSPYAGNLYPFRFISRDEYQAALEGCGLKMSYSEYYGRSYRGGEEYFEHLVVVATR